MTHYRAVVITPSYVHVRYFETAEKAEDFELEMRANANVKTLAIGDINGIMYTVVYYWSGD